MSGRKHKKVQVGLWQPSGTKVCSVASVRLTVTDVSGDSWASWHISPATFHCKASAVTRILGTFILFAVRHEWAGHTVIIHTQFDNAITGQQDIAGLQVTVNDLVTVQELQCQQHLSNHHPDLSLGQWLLQINHDTVQGTTSTKLNVDLKQQCALFIHHAHLWISVLQREKGWQLNNKSSWPKAKCEEPLAWTLPVLGWGLAAEDFETRDVTACKFRATLGCFKVL